MGRKAIQGETDLATTHPELAAELVDQELAVQLTAGSGRKVEWRCVMGHVWEAPVFRRSGGKGCHQCLGRRPHRKQPTLAEARPDLAAQLTDPKLGRTLTLGSNRKVTWRCSSGHEWDAVVASRVNGSGCRFCSGREAELGRTDLASTHPALAQELVEPEVANRVSAGSNRVVTWRCSRDHQWDAPVANRVRGKSCPYCGRRRAWPGETDLATTHPELAAQLVDQTLASDLLAGSTRRVEWQCQAGHRWTTSVSHRVRGTGCERCLGKIATVGVNDLATTHSDLASQLVEPLKAHTLTAGSNQRVRWRCSKGHEWTATVASRVSGNGCRYCAGRSAWRGESDLWTTHPWLAAQLVDPEIGFRVRPGSNKKAEWTCQHGHTWEAMVSNRVKGKGCPDCAPSGFSPESAAWLYLLTMPGGMVLKFGITNILDDRLAKHERQGFTEVVETMFFDTGADAQKAESRIKAHAKAQGWKPPLTAQSMPYGGATETLSVHDVGDGFTLSGLLAELDS